jgi:hypothetical protein
MKRLLPVLMGFVFLLLSSTEGWSGIEFKPTTPTPPCKGSPTSSVSNIASWTDCVGTYTFANGDKYVGEFRLGRRNGQGTLTFASGSKFVGEYKNGSRHGRGTFTYANGGVKEGIWENGHFIIEILSSQEPTLSSTTTQTPTSKPLIAYTNKRIALVVGNSKYKARPLDNPVRDARLIKTTLEENGFRVILAEDVDHREFRKALAEFKKELKDAGPETTAFFITPGMGYNIRVIIISYPSAVNSRVRLNLTWILFGQRGFRQQWPALMG